MATPSLHAVTLDMDIDLSEEFLSDVLVTAFDGDYGGCWYWATPDYEAKGDSAFIIRKSNDGDVWESITIIDVVLSEHRISGEKSNGREKVVQHVVDHQVIKTGIQRMLDGNWRDSILKSLTPLDAGNIDSELADVIVQMGIFGEVLYG